jgi:dTDP-4-dehydrorhamnose reductase
MVEMIKKGEQLKLFVDEFRTPARARNIARFILENLGQYQGVLNCGGRERLSRYDMGLALISAFGGHVDQLIGLRQEDLNLGAPRPKDVSLNSDLAFRLGYRHGTFSEELTDIQAGGGWLRCEF